MPAQRLTLAETDARTRVMRGRGERGPWELWQRQVPAELQGVLLGLWAGMVSEPCRHRVLPNGEACLMFHLGAAQRLIERDGARSDELLRAGFVSGLQQRPATFDSFAPSMRVVTARLSPLGAWLLLGGLPQVELARRVLEVDVVFEPRSGVTELHERMLHARDLGGALELLEDWLIARIRRARAPHPATRGASAVVADASGALKVAAIARESGISPRRLRELFLDEVGVTPKRLSRIVRFRQTLERLARATDIAPPRSAGAMPLKVVDLSRLALDCGYYDQPHLYREFRELAQMTPLEYLAAVGDGLDGADVIGG